MLTHLIGGRQEVCTGSLQKEAISMAAMSRSSSLKKGANQSICRTNQIAEGVINNSMKKFHVILLICFLSFFLTACSGVLCGPVNGQDSQDYRFSNVGPDLGYYHSIIPFDLSTWEFSPFDQDGIVMVNYGEEIGTQYNPVTVSQYALVNYNLYIHNWDERYREEFLWYTVPPDKAP
jgi:hypothetical protein